MSGLNISGSMLSTIITCVVVLVTIGVIAAVVGVVVHKVRSFSRSLFGTSNIGEGIQQQRELLSETPRSLHGMTSIYLPQIKKDFPEFDYDLYVNKAKSLLRSYFTAVSTKKALALTEECSLTLKNYVQGIIEDLNSRNVTQHFNEAVIHDIQIARYIKDGKTVTIMFEISVGYYSYITDSEGKVVFGDKSLKTQAVYEVGLMYVQDAESFNTHGDALGINCPNCGAPIKNLGNKFCEFCGTSVVEVNERAWKFNSVREQTTERRQF